MAGTTCPQAGGLARQSSSPASLHCSIDFVIRTSILLRMVLGRAIATPRGLPFPFRQLHRSPVMSIALPFVAFLLAGAFAAYHRLRLAWWAAITATLLVGCWLLGANPVATVIAGALTALIALPLLIPAIRTPLLTAPLLKFYRRLLPPLSQKLGSATWWERGVPSV